MEAALDEEGKVPVGEAERIGWQAGAVRLGYGSCAQGPVDGARFDREICGQMEFEHGSADHASVRGGGLAEELYAAGFGEPIGACVVCESRTHQKS